MWDDVLFTAIVAAGAGAAVIPALQRKVFGSVKEDWLAGELKLDTVRDGVTVINKDGSQTRAWQIRGISYDAKLDAEQISLLLMRTQLIRDLGRLGLSVRLVASKRRRPLDVAATWPCETLAEIGAAEAARYTSSHEVDWYLIASGHSAQALMDADQKIVSILTTYEAVALRQPEDLTQPCPLTGLLNGLVCGEYRRDLLPQSSNLSGAIHGAEMKFDRDTGTIRAEGEERAFMRVISITQWPDTVSGRWMGQLLGLDADLEISQVCEPWDTNRAIAVMKREENALSHSWLRNPTKQEEVEIILNGLNAGTMVLFVSQMQVIARASSPEALDTLVRQITAILGTLRIAYAVETSGAPAVWFSRLPEAAKPTVYPGGKLMRPLTLRDENIAALWPLVHAASGMPANPFGKGAVRLFRTLSGQVYQFQFHVSDKPQSRGNFVVFAPPGGGKSTLILHLLGGLAKWPGVLSVVLDSKEGARFMVEALGGLYQGFDQLALNPLDVGPESQRNRQRIYSILTAMCGSMALSSDDKAHLDHAVDLAFRLDPPHRTLTEIFDLSFPQNMDLRRQMARWVVDPKGHRGQYSHVFNAPHDSIGGLLRNHLVGINMNEALDDPDLGPPIVAHLAQALSQSAAEASRGFVIFIDEAAKLMQNPGFAALAAEMYREYRKLDGAVGMAFQDPAALLRSPVAEAIIEGSATMIFMPNAQANPEQLTHLGLNEEQVAFVCGRTVTAGQRQALVLRRDAASGLDESAILDVNLSYLGDALRFYRAGTEPNRHLSNLKAQWGDQWLRHL